MNLQIFGMNNKRSTKAQKDKKANKSSDLEASRFNIYSYPVVGMLLAGAFFLAANSITLKNLSLVWIVAVGVSLCVLVLHLYWIVFFDASHRRGAQRWRFNFFSSDMLVCFVIGSWSACYFYQQRTDFSFFSPLVIGLTIFSLFMINKFSPYRRMLLIKIAALWVPMILMSIYISFYIAENASEPTPLLLHTFTYCALCWALFFHAKATSNNFWKIRESEYLIRLKAETYQAATHNKKTSYQGNSEFTSAYSQELKIHLDSILSGVHLLKDTPISLQQKELIDMTEQAGERTITLIDTVVDYSRSSQKVAQSELTIFPVIRELEDLFVSLARDGHDHGIDTNFIFDKHLPQRIKGDKNIIVKVLTLLVSCLTRLNVSGKLLLSATYQSSEDTGALLRVRLSDLVESNELAKTHPLCGDLLSAGRMSGAVALNYLMAEDFTSRLGGTIKIQSAAEHGDGVGIEVDFPIEAKSGSTSDFYPNANLKDKHIAIVNCPEKIKSFVADELNNWGVISLFFDPEDFTWNLSAQEDNTETQVEKDLDTSLSDGVDQTVSRKNTLDRNLNDQFIENDIQCVLWFAEVADENIFNSKHSTVKKAIYSHDHLSSRPVFVVATDRQIQTSLHRQFLHEQPNIHVVQRPIQLKQFHHLLVDALFNVDFHAHHVLNKIFSLDDSSDKERILLVEDHRVNQMVAEGMLKRLGYKTKIANNGAEALQMLEEQEFDLILMDCQMAEMDGFTATEAIRIKEKSTDKHIPIIALTANTTEEDQNRCLAVGMDDYLAKPVRYGDLEHSLKRWLDDGSGASIHH